MPPRPPKSRPSFPSIFRCESSSPLTAAGDFVSLAPLLPLIPLLQRPPSPWIPLLARNRVTRSRLCSVLCLPCGSSAPVPHFTSPAQPVVIGTNQVRQATQAAFTLQSPRPPARLVGYHPNDPQSPFLLLHSTQHQTRTSRRSESIASQQHFTSST